MYRIDNSTAATALPTAGAVGPNVDGFFTRGSPSLATPATIVDDDWCNTIQEELARTIENAGITLTKGNYDQLKKAIDYYAQKNGAIYAASASSANTYTLTLTPAPVAYTEGMGVLVKFANHNTNSGVTINVNTLGAKNVLRYDGTALAIGDIADDSICHLVYDGTAFLMLNTVLSLFNNYANTTSPANTYTANLSNVPAAYTEGQMVLIKFDHHNTGAATINLNTLGAITMKRTNGATLLANDIADGMIAILVYDGTYFQLTNPNNTIATIKKQIFTADGTYTPSSGLLYAEIELVGGGGGGGGALATTVGTNGLGCSGGSGGYVKKLMTAAEIGASAACVVGVAGVGGTIPVIGAINVAQTSGADGTDTTFNPAGTGATLTGGRGYGGMTVQKNYLSMGIQRGGYGGTAINGDLNIPGQHGGGACCMYGPASVVCFVGGGGSNPLGVGAPAFQGENSTNGDQGFSYGASGYGSGGAGACATRMNPTFSFAGADGKGGVIIITEYCSN